MTGAPQLVVISPGSRSTPLVLALAAEPDFVLVDVIDERAAAFFALGHARATGQGAIVLATSGTAPAHWYPAILEAEASRLPLVCVSANRPTALSACGAPQTIDQHGLFGGHVRFFADLGDPRTDAGWLRHVERTVSRALAASVDGPVHLDVRFEKPLEPSSPEDATDLSARTLARALAGGGPRVTQRAAELARPELERIARRLAQAEAPLVLAGPLPAWTDPSPIRSLARSLGAPLAAEWGSQLHGRDVLTSLDLFVGTPRLPPVDLVVQLGATPTPSAYERWVASAGRPLPRLCIGASVADPTGMAEEHVLGDPAAIARALLPLLPARDRSSHADELARLDAEAARHIDELADGPSEGAAVRAAFAAAPAGSQILLGNSLPIRLADRFARTCAPGVAILVQRGVNGIDGLVAGALGAAHGGRPTLAILGDVTTLHDVGSLALARRLGAPLVLLVLDNGGGRIFEQLPIGARPELSHAMPHFSTEHGVDLCRVARAFDLPASRHQQIETLITALGEAFSRPGPTVLLAAMPPHDAAARERRLRAALELAP
jgi:2-succinyl-5-enolpyruvyl-6-hydroxy-3-cyclohexene-1-carboxylate synthase